MARRRYQEGSVALIKKANGTKQWVGRYYEDVFRDGTHTRIRRKVVLGTKAELPTESMARKALLPILNRVNLVELPTTGTTPTGLNKGMVTFEYVAQEWMADKLPYTPKQSSQANRRSNLKLHILPKLGKIAVGDLDNQLLQKWVNGLQANGLSSSSISSVTNTLSMVLDMAVDYGYIQKNPMEKVKTPKVEYGEKALLGVESVQHIIEQVTGVYRVAACVLAETGIRAGELVALRLADFDAQKRILRVRGTYKVSYGITAPKTKSSKRDLFLSERLTNMLMEMVGTRTEGQLFTGVDASQPVFFSSQSLLYHVRKAITTLGLNPLAFDLHSFRHFNASLMGSLQIPLRVIKERLGHSMNGDVTLGIYSHVFEADAKATAEKISAAIHGEQPKPEQPDLDKLLGSFLGLKLTPNQEAFKKDLCNLLAQHGLDGMLAAT